MDKKERIAQCLKEARGLCDRAEQEGRDFTPAERAEVNTLLAEAKRLKEEIKQAATDRVAGDAALSAAILELAGGDGHGAPAGKGGVWSTAFLKGLQPFHERQSLGTKQLITPSGSIGVPSLSEVIPALGERVESVLQVILTTPLANAASEYLREVTRTQNAVPVADSGTKPTSVYELEEILSPSQVIAHLSGPHPKRWFDDQANLRRYLDVVMRQGLQLALENQALNGNGVAPNLQGMLAVPGIQVQPFTVDILTTARMAITLIELINLPTDGLCFVFHPDAWETAELLETTVGGEYKMNNGERRAPINRQQRTLWGVQVALSTSLSPCQALLFHRGAVELKERQGVRLDWSENTYDSGTGQTDFARNLIRWRCEARYAFNVYTPRAIVDLDVCAGS